MTFDLDAEGVLHRHLTGLELEKNKHFCPVGVAKPGHEKIEGLLPDEVRSSVYGANSGLVQQAMGGSNEQTRIAKNQLKKLLLEEFKKQASPGMQYFKEFYKLVEIINKAMN